MYAQICHHRQELISQNTGSVKIKQVSFARIQYVDEMSWLYIQTHATYVMKRSVNQEAQSKTRDLHSYLPVYTFFHNGEVAFANLPSNLVCYCQGRRTAHKFLYNIYRQHHIIYIYIYIAIWISIQTSY